jgi:hypothetical protein
MQTKELKMKLQTIALALAVAAGGITAGQAFAQDRDVTITRDTPNGVVTKHIVRSDNDPSGQVMRRSTRVVRPDGSVVWRRTTRVVRRGDSDEYMRPQRVIVVRHHYVPERHVVVHRDDREPGYGGNRRVTVIHDAG